MDIQELLARRSDLGTFLVHLSRKYKGKSAKDNLKSMLVDTAIEARNPYGSAVSRLKQLEASTPDNLDSQKVVCFTETPLEHVRLLTEEIKWRKFQFEPYGIAITKRLARMKGVNPVWYLDITEGHDWLTQPLEKLIDAKIKKGTFVNSDIARLTPFIEQMGTGISKAGYQYFKEYWWEREWRHVGNFFLNIKFLIICPEDEFEEICNEACDSLPPKIRSIDPEWSLEQIIARVAGFKPDEVDPF